MLFYKDPDAVLDYRFDWSAWLDGDTIDSATVTADDGITVASSSNDDTTVTAWLSGGTVGSRYAVVSRIVTVGGRTDDRSMTVAVVANR